MTSTAHLTHKAKINQGSYYTPDKFVDLAGQWLKSQLPPWYRYTFLDSSCGYGAFFQLQQKFPYERFIGNDIDSEAVEAVRLRYPDIETHVRNSLSGVCREAFNIKAGETLCIIANPPYNDITSRAKRGQKTTKPVMDDEIRTRDLGLSFLNSYALLRPAYALIIHPLGYLIKRANFKAALRFFSQYRIVCHNVFPSREFRDTSRETVFPIIMALYEHDPFHGMTYESVRNFLFVTADGTEFKVSQWDYIGDYVQKYPTKKRYAPEYWFYSLRDINVLLRSKTFLEKPCNGAVNIDPALLNYYCYLDAFRYYGNVPYWMRNFDVPFYAATFGAISDDVVALTQHAYPNIFGNVPEPTQDQKDRVKRYIDDVIGCAGNPVQRTYGLHPFLF